MSTAALFAIGRAGVDCFAGLLDSLNVFRLIPLFRDEERRRNMSTVMRKTLLLNVILIALVDISFRSVISTLVSNLIVYRTPFDLIYYTLWIIPVYILSFMINTIGFAEIAEIARPPRGNMGGLDTVILEKLGSTGIKLSLTIQMLLLAEIPYLGRFISFVYASWYWSYSCFEYRWINDGIPLPNRMGYFEVRWPYYLGFGATVELLYETLPFFIAYGTTAMYFAIMIVFAALAPERDRCPIRFSVFKQAESITNLACERFGSIFDIIRSSVIFITKTKKQISNFFVNPKNRSAIMIFIILLTLITIASLIKIFNKEY